MKNIRHLIFILCCIWSINLASQEYPISGYELSIDQDYFADFLRDSIVEDRNYTIGLRAGFYGENANNPVFGLPWLRQTVDDFFLRNFLYNMGFREDGRSHSLMFTINGFSPSLISDETAFFQQAVADGYSLEMDRPFSSFTGFRSSRRLEGSKAIPHAAGRMDLAFNTSVTIGFASIGLAHAVEDLFGAKRPDGNLWSRDEQKPYPTGQLNPILLPMFMYSMSVEATLMRPMKKVVLQMRPEINLGYYTNIGIGLDLGKVMNVERLVDNLGYTDTHNPGTLKVNNEDISFALSLGGTVRAVLYNAHLNGLYGASKGENYYTLGEIKKFIWEAYAGFKVQFFKKLELSFTINRRSSEINSPVTRNPMWGTVGVKWLMASEGEGCYD